MDFPSPIRIPSDCSGFVFPRRAIGAFEDRSALLGAPYDCLFCSVRRLRLSHQTGTLPPSLSNSARCPGPDCHSGFHGIGNPSHHFLDRSPFRCLRLLYSPQPFFSGKTDSRENVTFDTLPSSASSRGPLCESIPLPVITTDSSGIVVEANKAFSSLVPGGEISGKPVTEFFIPGEDFVSLGAREYIVFQAPLDGLFFFALVEMPRERKKREQSKGTVSLLDPATGLYSHEYATIRTAEELSRAFRYRRWLCGVLLAVEFTYVPGLNYQEDMEKSFLAAFSSFVRTRVRDSDIAFYLGDRKILILLPETPQQGAKDVSLKLMDLPEPLAELKNSFPFSVEIEYGFVYYSGNYPMSKEQFLEKLHSNLGGASE